MDISVLLIICCLGSTVAWDSEQLEVFDTVEEVKLNFYELLNVSKDATNAEIRSAFRGLSLKLHPDKNLDVDTSEQFRNLVSVYDILRSSTKRKYYDEVLITGLPNWRSGLFYYRFVRKMGITEVIIILFIIISIGQYLVKWGAYFEEKFTYQEKANKKKGRKSKFEDEPVIDLPWPSLYDTLPIQIPRLIWFLIISIPTGLGYFKSAVEQKLEEVKRPPTPEPAPEPLRVKSIRKRNKFVVPEGPNFEIQPTSFDRTSSQESPPPPVSGGLWTDDDLAELVRLVKKFPQGSPRRWESIADALGRLVPEVTYMSNKLKENGYKVPAEQEAEVQQVKVKLKTKREFDTNEEVRKWSQLQQKALEDALAMFPKGCSDRWDRIAEHVPDKTKDDCILRFRYLAENLKKQKESNIKSNIEE